MQREVSPSGTLVGTLLEDASIPLRKGKSVLRFEFEQTIANAQYIQYF